MNKEIKVKLGGQEMILTDKSFGLSMNVDPSAEPCAQVIDFYQRSLIKESDATNFNNVPFNKGKKRIPLLTTGNLLKAWTCSFSGSNVDLSAKETEVDKVACMVEICKADLEDSFLVDSMKQGANNSISQESFLTYLWAQIGEQVGEDVEILRWLGDKAGGATPFLKLTDGYLKQLTASSGLLAGNLTMIAGGVNPTNVIGEIFKVINLVPKQFRSTQGRNSLRIFVSSNVALSFQAATANATAQGAYVTDTGDLYLGRYRLIETSMLPNNTIVASPVQDLIYTYDLINDGSNFITVDRTQSAAEEIIRFRVNLYFGFDLFDPSHIVYYHP